MITHLGQYKNHDRRLLLSELPREIGEVRQEEKLKGMYPGSSFAGYLAPEGSIPGYFPPESSIPGYLPPEGSALASHRLLQPRPGGYGSDILAGVGSQGVPGYSGLPARAITRGYSPLDDPSFVRRDALLGIKPGLIENERSEPFIKSENLLVDESNVLFVDGLPRDCTRREMAHLFRPFIGFKEIRVVHKEPRRVGEKGHVLCFVEFDDAKCALTALQALQGYKFDDKKPDAPVMRIQFATFPFRPPQLDQRHGVAH